MPDIPFIVGLGFSGEALVVQAALVGDDMDELLSDEATEQLTHKLWESANRRKLRPKDTFVVVNLDVDQPGWEEFFAPNVLAEIQKGRDEIKGHVRAALLIDTYYVDLFEPEPAQHTLN